MKGKCPGNLLFGHQNVIYLHKKIDWFEDIKNIFDKFLIMQTKLDLSFPDAHFDMLKIEFWKWIAFFINRNYKIINKFISNEFAV